MNIVTLIGLLLDSVCIATPTDQAGKMPVLLYKPLVNNVPISRKVSFLKKHIQKTSIKGAGRSADTGWQPSSGAASS